MMISKRSFRIKNRLNINLLDNFCEKGIIPVVRKGRLVFIDDSLINSLVSGVHYVECPFCNEKMACVTNKHLKACGGGHYHEPIYSELYLKNHKKTEEQKKQQSEKLKKRFFTSKGEITRKQIGEASRRLNSDPGFIEKKRKASQEIQNRPENKQLRSKKSKEMWSDPEFRLKMRKYVEDNADDIRKSAANARRYLKKQSNLHAGYKKAMLEKGLTGFITEYTIGPYSVDEADPFAKIAVEVDGCYWHGCPSCGFPGDTRIQKIDRRKTSYLKNRGWIIFRVKEHEIKKDPFVGIEMIRNVQKKRRTSHEEKIKESFALGLLKVQSMVEKSDDPQWVPMSDIVRHHTPHKKMITVTTEIGSVRVTEDHSLFDWKTKDSVEAKNLKLGSRVVGVPWKKFEPLKVVGIEETEPEEFTFDVSVPGPENAVLDSGILVHNTYSISGVSLDLEKSSKYQSMKDQFIGEYDKIVEENKRSIKIIKGLRQFRYGVGITSALGPLNRAGVQSRRNWISPYRSSWS